MLASQPLIERPCVRMAICRHTRALIRIGVRGMFLGRLENTSELACFWGVRGAGAGHLWVGWRAGSRAR